MKEKEFRIPTGYLNGHLRNGVLIVHLSEEEISEYNELNNDEDREDYLTDKGYLEIIDYRINSYDLDLDNFKKL